LVEELPDVGKVFWNGGFYCSSEEVAGDGIRRIRGRTRISGFHFLRKCESGMRMEREEDER